MSAKRVEQSVSPADSAVLQEKLQRSLRGQVRLGAGFDMFHAYGVDVVALVWERYVDAIAERPKRGADPLDGVRPIAPRDQAERPAKP